MTIPLIVLAIFSVAGGLLNLPHFAGGNEFLAHWLAPLLPTAESLGEVSFLSLEMGAPLIAAFVPPMLAIYVFSSKKLIPQEDNQIQGITKLIYHKFYIDELYDFIIVKPVNFLSVFFGQVIDFLVIDLFVEGIGKLVQYASTEFRRIQTGNVGYYVFMMVISITIILFMGLKSWIL
jgi:NADH-quinone oxidoreductase subunit L